MNKHAYSGPPQLRIPTFWGDPAKFGASPPEHWSWRSPKQKSQRAKAKADLLEKI